MKTKLIVLMGLQGSGKSTKAFELKEKMSNTLIISSDDLREELLGDRTNQEHKDLIFKEVYKRVKENLQNGVNVIYDATNTNSRRRVSFLRGLPKNVEKILYYINETYDRSCLHDKHRKYKVGKECINKTYKGLQVPYSHEKWDNIVVDIGVDKYKYIDYITQQEVFKRMSQELISYDDFTKIINDGSLSYSLGTMFNVCQDNPNHTFSIDKHTYYVYEYIFKKYEKEDREDLIIASLFHDVGKPFCKEYPSGLRYARYFGHENVGGQITLRELIKLGYSQERALKIASLVGLHMRMSFSLDMMADRKLENLVGEETFIKLNYLRQADIQAK